MPLESNFDLPSSKKFIFNVLLELVICFWENDTDILLLGVIMNAFIVVIAIVSTINIVRKDIFYILWFIDATILDVYLSNFSTPTLDGIRVILLVRKMMLQTIDKFDYKKVQSCSWCVLHK
jgi:hypothetical protein